MRMPMTAAGDATPARGQPGPGTGRLARLKLWARHAPALARRHWVFAVLLTAGLVLRILTQLAYRPVLLYTDSTKYLLGAYPGDDPPGYQLALKPVLALGNLDLIAVIQHLLGLGMAVMLGRGTDSRPADGSGRRAGRRHRQHAGGAAPAGRPARQPEYP